MQTKSKKHRDFNSKKVESYTKYRIYDFLTKCCKDKNQNSFADQEKSMLNMQILIRLSFDFYCLTKVTQIETISSSHENEQIYTVAGQCTTTTNWPKFDLVVSSRIFKSKLPRFAKFQ